MDERSLFPSSERARLRIRKVVRTWTALIGSAAIVLAGCGSSTSGMPIPAATTYSCDLPSTLPIGALRLQGTALHSLGDSITAGFLLSSPSTQAYPVLIGEDLGLSITDEAISGMQACDLAPREIFPNNENPTAASGQLYTMMIGTNDAARDVAEYVTVFALCHQAALAWLAVPAEAKVRANDPSVQTAGLGAFSTNDNWLSWDMSAAGSSITLPITVSAGSPIYLWTRILDNDGGTFTWSVDGVAAGTGNTSTTPVIKTSAGSAMSMSLSRIAGEKAGIHTVTITQNSTTGTVRVLAVGSPPAAKSARPQVLASDIPYFVGTASTGCAGTATADLRYIQQIQADVEILAGDGLSITYVPTRRFFFGTASELVDQVHPNAFGHIELRNAFESAIQR